jgi:hypothetical protein
MKDTLAIGAGLLIATGAFALGATLLAQHMKMLDMYHLNSERDIAYYCRHDITYETDPTKKEIYKSLIRRGCYVLRSEKNVLAILNLKDQYTKEFLVDNTYKNLIGEIKKERDITKDFALYDIPITLESLDHLWKKTWYDSFYYYFDDDPFYVRVIKNNN